MIIGFIIALGVSFFSSYWYFTWVRRSLDRALKTKKPAHFTGQSILRLLVATVWLALMAILFGRMPALLIACAVGIFIGRKYAFKSR